MIRYCLILALLVAIELLYFRIAGRFGIIDKPNERSSHVSIVIRGGGVIFTIGMWIWTVFSGMHYLWFIAGLTLVAGVSFMDDIRSLPNSVRLVVQFAAAAMALLQIGALSLNWWLTVSLAGLVIFVGIMNVYNFMDGINGITGGYSLAVLLPLMDLNVQKCGFVEQDLLVEALLSVFVFCLFNFRPKGKARCFAGDVGSIGIAFIILFAMSALIIRTKDVTYLLLLVVYGVDSCMTICHRILLHENLGVAHRKHAYQIMANELGIGHLKITGLYMCIQLVISLIFIYLIPDTVLSHWLYLSGVVLVLCAAYLLFMKKYYHLHEEYLV